MLVHDLIDSLNNGQLVGSGQVGIDLAQQRDYFNGRIHRQHIEINVTDHFAGIHVAVANSVVNVVHNGESLLSRNLFHCLMGNQFFHDGHFLFIASQVALGLENAIHHCISNRMRTFDSRNDTFHSGKFEERINCFFIIHYIIFYSSKVM